MGCTFCLTGKYVFKGDLSTGEIINWIISRPYAGEVTNVVFMNGAFIKHKEDQYRIYYDRRYK